MKIAIAGRHVAARFVQTCFFAAAVLFGAVAEAAVTVHPRPHEVRELGGAPAALSAASRITGVETADADAVRLLRARLAGMKGAGATEIIIGEKGSPAAKAYEAGLPAVSGAYRLSANAGRVAIVGYDKRGTFYGVQTLLQLLDAGPVPAVEIMDAPDVALRGTVEGFYGTPWPHAARLAQLAFYGRFKMNTYIYAPKDDPYHSSPNWRKPYPAADAGRIRELVAAARANKVDFVWAIHPGKDIKWTEEDFQAVKGKFEAMYGLGVRSFAVFFDDISGEGTKAEKQAGLLNRLALEFVRAKGDVTPLILCPTQYNRAWSGGDYLDVLGKTLDPAILIMWTGNSVVADIDGKTMEWINRRIRRKACIWWNFPVSDFVRNHLLLGPAYGNSPDIAGELSGFVSNPMDKPEASKIALYGVAGYAWNLKGYDAAAAWEAGIRDLMPKAAAAFRTFAAHNSDLGPNGHGYRRDESVEIKPVAARFLEGWRNGKPAPADTASLRAEFACIAAAPAAIRAGTDNRELLNEIDPWLDAFAALGRAGTAAMDFTTAANRGEAWNAYARAVAALDELAEIDRTRNRNPYQPGIKTGSLVLEPLVSEVLKTGAARITAAFTGRPVATPRPFTNSGTKDGLDKMLGGNPKEYYYSQQVQKAGDYFGVDLGADIPVSRVRILMGRKDGDHDIVHKGQLEWSRDGKTWAPLGGETTGESVAWEGRPVLARQVRYRVTRAGKLDGSKNDVWAAFRLFAVNPAETQPKVRSSVAAIARLPVRGEASTVSISPALEVMPLPANGEIGLEFPDAAALKRLEADLASPDAAIWTRIEFSTDGRTWRQAKAAAAGGTAFTADINAPARFVRVRNASNKPRDIKLSAFKVLVTGSSGTGGDAWTDGRLETSAVLGRRCTLDIPPGAVSAVLLFAPGSGRGTVVAAEAADGSGAITLGAASADAQEFAIPAGRSQLIITPGNGEAKLHEILWRKKN